MLGDRLKLIRQEFRMNQMELADKLGVSQNAVSQYETGARNLSDDLKEKLCEQFGIDLNWLITGRGEMYDGAEPAAKDVPQAFSMNEPGREDDLVYIDLLDAKACAGYGIENFDPQVVESIPIARRFVYPYRPEHVRLVEVTGNSMEPTLSPGDYVAVAEQVVSGNGVYLINKERDLFVKRVAFKLDSMQVSSDNPLYPAYEVRDQKPDFAIIGRVIFQIRRF